MEVANYKKHTIIIIIIIIIIAISLTTLHRGKLQLAL